MKLFYSTGTSSLSAHIVLEEAGLRYEGIEVSWSRNQNVAELEKLSPRGAVPVLVSDQGKVLTQNAAILEYVADLAPSKKLLAPAGHWERVEALSWVAFASADLQRSYSPIFGAERMTQSKEAQAEIEKFGEEQAREHLGFLDQALQGKEYIVGGVFTVADIHLFTISGMAEWVDISLKDYPALETYRKRISQRPVVQKVLKIEDMLD